MKKVNSSVVLFLRTHLFAQGVNENQNVFNAKLPDTGDQTTLHSELVLVKMPSLKTTRKFKIALISSYTFLISIFAVLVYTAILLDPKFPF